MKVDIYSRKAIEELINNGFPENVAVISFYDPPGKHKNVEPPVDYKGKAKKLFQVAVYDIDLEVLDEFGLTYDTYFTEVEELAEFVIASYHKGLNIICQCEYGQSRSAACAAAILEYFEGDGISVFKDYRYYPNQLIFNKVYDELNLQGMNLIKNHKLYTIGNYIVQNHPEKKVCYTTGQRIVEEMITVIKKDGNVNELRNKYSKIDVLLIDDIQFMNGKERTQMEFLNIVKAMRECGKQIIVYCDRATDCNEMLFDGIGKELLFLY